jgi:hypothetical protein
MDAWASMRAFHARCTQNANHSRNVRKCIPTKTQVPIHSQLETSRLLAHSKCNQSSNDSSNSSNNNTRICSLLR